MIILATYIGVSKNRDVFPKNGWFIVENLIKIDEFGGTNIFGNTHIGILISFLFFGFPTGIKCHLRVD